MDADLTVQPNHEIDVTAPPPSFLIPGSEQLTGDDLGRFPRVRISSLNRPINDDRDRAGWLFNTLTGEPVESMQVAVVSFGKGHGHCGHTRARFVRPFDATAKPLCVSDDSILPIDDPEARRCTDLRSGPCADCEDAQWPEGGGGPLCSDQINTLVYDRDSRMVVHLTWARTALPVAKQANLLALAASNSRKWMLLTTRLRKEDTGNWFTPVYALGDPMTTEEQWTVYENRKSYGDWAPTADLSDMFNLGNGDNGDDELDNKASQYAAAGEQEIPF